MIYISLTKVSMHEHCGDKWHNMSLENRQALKPLHAGIYPHPSPPELRSVVAPKMGQRYELTPLKLGKTLVVSCLEIIAYGLAVISVSNANPHPWFDLY